jgi:tetratricopeptide (TPR) repeat protein
MVWSPETAAALGTAYSLDGRIADAVALLTQAMEQINAMESVEGRVQCPLALGEAQAMAEHAWALARQHQERGHQSYALRLLDKIAARPKHLESESAETHDRQALSLAEELRMRPLQAHGHRGLGTLYATTGRRQQAQAPLSIATEMYCSMAMTWWLSQAETALAQVE